MCLLQRTWSPCLASGSVETALQILVSGVFTGAEYALAAVGMTLIFGVGRVLNLAHGAFLALGAYIAYQSTVLGLPAVAGAVPAAAAGSLLGAAVERVTVRPLRAQPLTAAVVLLGLAILAEQGFSAAWGTSSHSVPLRLPTLLFGRLVLSMEQLIAAGAVVALLAMVAGYLWTRPGLALRAAAADAEIAQLAGVNVPRVQTATFGVACGMAAVAGAFLSPLLTLSPTMGRSPLFLSLAIVAIAGPGRVWGTIVAGIGVGLASTAIEFYLAPPWAYVLALVLLITAVVSRADGALGRMRPGRRSLP